MMENLSRVQGHDDLYRDDNTGMIISINKHDASHYKNIRAQKIKEKQELETLKSDVNDIKAMLQQLLENKTNG